VLEERTMILERLSNYAPPEEGGLFISWWLHTLVSSAAREYSIFKNWEHQLRSDEYVENSSGYPQRTIPRSWHGPLAVEAAVPSPHFCSYMYHLRTIVIAYHCDNDDITATFLRRRLYYVHRSRTL